MRNELEAIEDDAVSLAAQHGLSVPIFSVFFYVMLLFREIEVANAITLNNFVEAQKLNQEKDETKAQFDSLGLGDFLPYDFLSIENDMASKDPGSASTVKKKVVEAQLMYLSINIKDFLVRHIEDRSMEDAFAVKECLDQVEILQGCPRSGQTILMDGYNVYLSELEEILNKSKFAIERCKTEMHAVMNDTQFPTSTDYVPSAKAVGLGLVLPISTMLGVGEIKSNSTRPSVYA